MLDPIITDIQARDGFDFDRRGNPVAFRSYSFFIGSHGPFTEKFYAGEQDTPAVERRLNNRVLQLRELGIVPAPQS